MDWGDGRGGKSHSWSPGAGRCRGTCCCRSTSNPHHSGKLSGSSTRRTTTRFDALGGSVPRSDGICACDLTLESGEEASVHFTDAFAQCQEASMDLTHFPDRLRDTPWLWPRLENTAGSSGSATIVVMVATTMTPMAMTAVLTMFVVLVHCLSCFVAAVIALACLLFARLLCLRSCFKACTIAVWDVRVRVRNNIVR